LLEKLAVTLYGSVKMGVIMGKAVIWTLVMLIGASVQVRADEAPGTAELVVDVESIQPGVPFRAGVLLRLPDHWHTYWRNAGDSGMPPEITWQLPEGFAAGPILWPAPKTFDEPPVMSFGYDREVLLSCEIRPPEDSPAAATYILEAKLVWLVCREVCIPKTNRLRLTLPAQVEPPAKASRWAELFARAKQTFPVRDDAWTFRARVNQGVLSLCATPPPGVSAGDLARAVFYPVQPNLVAYEPPAWEWSETESCLRMKRISGNKPLPDRLEGVLVVPRGKALEVNITLEK